MESLIALETQLQVESTIAQLPNVCLNRGSSLTTPDIARLLNYASQLALSSDDLELQRAYEIVSRLLELFRTGNPFLSSGAEIVFARLGNFPSRQLLRQRHRADEMAMLSPALSLEAMSREIENTYYDDQHATILTDFQYKLLSSLHKRRSLSVSAPTSAGKSFIMGLDLIRRLKDEGQHSIVYLVPTRALISEVSQRIRSSLKEEGINGVLLRTAPFPVEKQKVRKAVIYVLTQERLMSLISTQDRAVFVTALLVDEAHEIQNGKRGIVLQNAIDATLRKCPSADVFFASPLVANPDYFLNLFGRANNGQFMLESRSPVSQNIILLSAVKSKPELTHVVLLNQQQPTEIGQFDLGFRFRPPKYLQKSSLAARLIGNKDALIVFCNGPADAEKVAHEIAKQAPQVSAAEELNAFVAFLSSDIHPDYALIDCLKSGIGFHYGRMPSLVRAGVEKLFRLGQIKAVCSTSTLLQGVNLPAKHIIIDNPMSGNYASMSRANFLNLAGRAGRLNKEFHGNVWCLQPDSWKENCLIGESLQTINSATSEVMKDGGLIVQDLLDNTGAPADKDIAETTFGKLYHDALEAGSEPLFDLYRNQENEQSLKATLDRIKTTKVTLPISILESHKSLRPDHLQHLYEHLDGQIMLDAFIPRSPFKIGTKEDMDRVFGILADIFNWSVSPKYLTLISNLAYRWVRGTPLRVIFQERCEYIQRKDRTKTVSEIIRNYLDVLEKEIRFNLVRYTAAYIDILKTVLTKKQLDEDCDEIEPYHIYLEFGSCNKHALNLMALGLSRFTAIYLQRYFDIEGDDTEAEEYLQILNTLNIDRLKIPRLCQQEVKEILR